MVLLRKICNHPYLIEYPLKDGEYLIDEQLVESCGKLKIMDCLLPALKAEGRRVGI
jgi:ATP-dependent DNA helicase